MIQRIQSVYLLLVVVLMSVTLFMPLGYLGYVEGDIFSLVSTGIVSGVDIVYPTWGIVSVGALVALLALIEIFSFKNRKRQINLSLINIFLIVFFYVTIAVYIYAFQGPQGCFTIIRPGFGLILPFIALVFNVLALLRIKKDEKLIRSLDRIR